MVDTSEIKKQIDETIMKMAMEPTNPDHYHALANLYALDNNFDKVASVYESLLSIKPDDVNALLNLGSIYFYSKDFRKALTYYNKAKLVKTIVLIA